MQNSRMEGDKPQDNASMLTSFDLGTLEDMDPSLSRHLITTDGGFRVVYDKEVPIELRYDSPQQACRGRKGRRRGWNHGEHKDEDSYTGI